MLFDHLSGKDGLRSSQVGVSSAVLLFSDAQSCLHNSSCIKLKWHGGILDDLRSQEVKTNKEIKAPATKQSDKIKTLDSRDICE